VASILIIEDDNQHLEYLRETIEFGGHVAHTAKNASVALEIIEKIQIEYIITDIYLPGLTGLEFIEFLQSNGIKTPFVVITGSHEEEHRNKAQELNAVEFLVKPIDPEELLKSIVI
jgi:YesN/AraC family two-component response regulator